MQKDNVECESERDPTRARRTAYCTIYNIYIYIYIYYSGGLCTAVVVKHECVVQDSVKF